jgi:hypothetical protein
LFWCVLLGWGVGTADPLHIHERQVCHDQISVDNLTVKIFALPLFGKGPAELA